MNPTPIPAIAVLLTCYNRRNKTVRSLDGLFAQKGSGSKFSIEVFLVDDASTDFTAESVADRYPQVTIIQGNGSLYWNKGMHLAWETAARKKDFDFYLWLNDDTYILPDAVLTMLDSYYAGDTDAIICGVTKSEVTNQLTYGGRMKSGLRLIPNGELQSCDLLNGNFVLVSKKIFQKIGMIDPIFPHSMGDFDYGLRGIENGFKIFTTRSYIGYCERHDRLPRWCSPDVPLNERLRSLYSPLGNHPYYFFIYERRHFGRLTAIKHFFTIHLRAFVPSLWKNRVN